MDINWGSIITEILREILPIVIMAFVGYLATEVHKLAPVLRAKYEATFTAEQQQVISQVVHTAVLMAEQVAKRDDIQQAAQAKRDMAFEYVNTRLEHLGISLTSQEVYALIEASVHQQFHWGSTN